MSAINVDSLAFAVFCTALLLLTYLFRKDARNLLLLIASYAFYASWSVSFLFILIAITTFNYLLAPYLARQQGRSVRLALWIGIAVNLTVLGAFKHADFFVPELLAMLSGLGWDADSGVLPVLIPVGLSFQTLQAISYLVDTSRGQLQPCRNARDFALYLAWFPKLTAGPIERPGPFLTQLANPPAVDRSAVTSALSLILLGLVRKLVIADPLLGAIPEALRTDPGSLSSGAIFFWLLIFGVGLYNDFAGYTAIVRGVSRLFGIELSKNFAQPFFSTNYVQFWSRWHMSLSFWLRDYIYYPVNRALMRRQLSRYNLAAIAVPSMLTMLVSGWWHGGTWSLILWGALMGAYQVAERIFALARPVRPVTKQALWARLFGAGIFICSLALAMPLFLSPLDQAMIAWSTLFSLEAWAAPLDLDSRVWLLVIPSFWIDWMQYRSNNDLVFLELSLSARLVLASLALLSIFLFTRVQIPEPFIYQGF